jgi:hypothetical protein
LDNDPSFCELSDESEDFEMYVNDQDYQIVAKKPSTSGKNSNRNKSIMSPKVSAALDRTNTFIRKSTVIITFVRNESACSKSKTVLSKSTVHRYRQRRRPEIAEQIKAEFRASKCIVHWNGKLLPDATRVDTGKVDRYY